MKTNRTKINPKRIPPKSTLYDWIKPKINDDNTNNTLPETNDNRRNTNHPKPTKSPPHRQHHQQQLNPTSTDNQWGDELSSSPNVFRVASKNVNTLSPEDNLLQWCGVAHAMRSYQLNSLTIQEPNTKWNDHLQQRVQRIFQQTFRQVAFSTSKCTEPSNTYQPGGTALTIIGPHAT